MEIILGFHFNIFIRALPWVELEQNFKRPADFFQTLILTKGMRTVIDIMLLMWTLKKYF